MSENQPPAGTVELTIDEFDLWTNPVGTALAPTTICWGDSEQVTAA